jgi:hypothetical protein
MAKSFGRDRIDKATVFEVREVRTGTGQRPFHIAFNADALALGSSSGMRRGAVNGPPSESICHFVLSIPHTDVLPLPSHVSTHQ